MNVCLKKADFGDCAEILRMQAEAFTQLLDKYQDFSTNPASESLEAVERKYMQD